MYVCVCLCVCMCVHVCVLLLSPIHLVFRCRFIATKQHACSTEEGYT